LFALTRLGREAVVVFFVLSGFLVGGRALRDLAERRFDGRRYAADRASRLYAVLLPALCLTAVCDAVRGGWSNVDNGMAVFVGNLLFLQDVTTTVYGSNGPLWSLAFEAWYYALFGIGVRAAADVRDGRLGRAALAAILLAVALAWLGHRNPRIVMMFPLWLGGAALAWQAAFRRWPVGYRPLLWVALPAALFGSFRRGDEWGDLMVGIATLMVISAI
jgi:peptidoglycan/LPS O-acetylase OafA/YrhL